MQSGSVLNTAATSFLSSQYVNFGKPKAYLNWILFDEQFNLVSSSSGFEQVSDSAWQTHVKTNLPVNANGYLYIYVSNATPNIAVYFDNLQVTHIHGALLQENHYYPHGLAMAGISDAAITTAAPNIYKANGSSSLAGAEWADGTGLEMYETPARSYDAQIGRFGQTDPLMEEAANTSSYEFVLNNPVSDVDPMGLQGGNPYSQVQHLTDFQTGQPTWWGSMEGVAGMPSKAMDGGGGGSSGAYAAFWNSVIGQAMNTPGTIIYQSGLGDPLLGYNYSNESGSGMYMYSTYHGQGGFNNETGEDYKYVGYGPVFDFDDLLKEYNARYGSEGQPDIEYMTHFDDGIGGLSSGMKAIPGTFRLTNGIYNGSEFSPKFYESGWSGGSTARITTYQNATWGKNIGKGARIGTLVLGAASILYGVYEDGGTYGKHAQKATGSTVGGWAGAEAGAQVGAEIGLAFGPVGALIGGIAGGIIGGWFGSKIGEDAVEELQ